MCAVFGCRVVFLMQYLSLALMAVLCLLLLQSFKQSISSSKEQKVLLDRWPAGRKGRLYCASLFSSSSLPVGLVAVRGGPT